MSGGCQHGRVLADHDFHPDEPAVRIFRTPSPGVLRLDDDVAISEAVYDEAVLRHYAFAAHWFKVNVTISLSGCLTETGDPGCRFAVNCDIATPMERDGDSTFGVDLFTNVVVRDDATSYSSRAGTSSGTCWAAASSRRRRAAAPGAGCGNCWTSSSKDGCCGGSANSPRSGRASLPRRRRCAAARYLPACGRESAGPGDTRRAGPGPAGHIMLACARFERADSAPLAVPDGRWRADGLLRPARPYIRPGSWLQEEPDAHHQSHRPLPHLRLCRAPRLSHRPHRRAARRGRCRDP